MLLMYTANTTIEVFSDIQLIWSVEYFYTSLFLSPPGFML
jgi:hypothetical protein